MAAAALGLLLAAVVVAALAARSFRSQVAAVLYLSPAAASVDDDSQISVSGLGWRGGEQVAICLVSDPGQSCDEANALLVEGTDAEGAFRAMLDAGSWLQQGFTTVVAQGLDSGALATRTFRVLVAPAQADLARQRPDDAAQDDTLPDAGDDTINLPLVVSGDGGWQGDYFDNPNLAGEPVLQRVDDSLSMNWGSASPGPGLPDDGFSARWTTRAPFAGRRYAFTVSADGGVRLYVDGQIVIDRWTPEAGAVSGAVDLLPGDRDVVVEYFNASGPAFVSVGWSESNEYPDWRGEYFPNADLTGAPALIRNDPAVNFNWGRSGPAPSLVAADDFSARWTRTLEFVAGDYRWAVTADDGARLLVDGQVILDAWQGPAGQPVTVETPLTAGQHMLVVEMRNTDGEGAISLDWNVAPAETLQPDTTPEPTDEAPTATPEPATATPDLPGQATETPTDIATVAPGSTATPTGVPGATATPTPTGDTPTATPTATNGSGGSATVTPTPTVTPTTTNTPQALVRNVDVAPFPAVPGDTITLTTGDWTPGIRVTVALVEDNRPFSESVEVPGTMTTTPSNPAQGFSIQFVFPIDDRWQLGNDVWIIIHNAAWTEWGVGELELNEE